MSAPGAGAMGMDAVGVGGVGMDAAVGPRTDAPAGAADPVTAEILASAFSAIAEEMAVVEYRSSFSPIIREMLDFNCGLFDATGRMIAHSEQIPAQLGLMQFALQAALEKHGALAPGDAVLTNHPYMGGTHTPDLQVFAPIHHGGRLVGYGGSIAHHIDIGGRVPGTESAQSTELFHEGLIFPAVKLTEDGRRNRALYELIAANVRDPNATLGDLDAQLAACRRGAERLSALCSRYGAGVVTGAMADLLDRTAARAAAAFARWPARAVSAEGFLDDGGFPDTPPVGIRLTAEVRDGALEVDLTGTDDQVPSGVNVPLASTHAGVFFAVRSFIGVPQNAGLTRQIRLRTRPGSLLDPVFPTALSARHLAVQRLADLMVQALGDLLPERAVASSHVSFPAFVFQAVDPRVGRMTLLADILGGGGGARRDAPGDDAIDPYTSNCALLPAEIAEMEYPWRVLRSELVDGSGGAGAQRGGLGLRRDYELLADHAEGMYYVEQRDPRFAARGRDGGGPGAGGRALLRRAGAREFEELPGKGYIHLSRGDIVSFVGAGGGGFGTPGQPTSDADGSPGERASGPAGSPGERASGPAGSLGQPASGPAGAPGQPASGAVENQGGSRNVDSA
ncbi:MAG TPA: hydantoinase B/oxoprolinase family protein [Solirubrobacteraceae bacterium]|nr:hydantoinase B/oxoprolinase family protein [Solirubrobacteraceae bacterium]